MENWRQRLRNVGTWLSQHRKETIGVVSLLVIFVVAAPALASEGNIGYVNTLALWIATLFSWIAQHVVKLIVLLIDVVVVPVMRYNNFASSAVVGQGWSVVRDLVNMFFVVILLLIAFQTIFGIGRADWKRQVPRLLIMAVVINFSRTIAGMLIDVGQVIMFTFVNAIADVAGGNFIQLFGLDRMFEYSQDAVNRAGKSGAGFEAFDFFGAAFLTMVLTFVVLATMVILAGLLAFRIVILWCLIIVAPLTFFLGGAKGVIGGAEGYYADWWKRFTAAVSLGPILSFFVWLSLAAASSGNLAEKQGFDFQQNNDEAANVAGEITQAFDAPHMTSLIIAVALLFAGFEVSQQTAGSLGGRAGTMAAAGVKGIPGLARSLAKVGVPAGAVAGSFALAPVAATGAVAAGLVATKQWTRAGDKDAHKKGLIARALNFGTTASREGIVKDVGTNIRDVGGVMAKSGIPGITSFGRRVQNIGFKTIQGQNKHSEHEWDEATKENAAMGFENLRELASMETTSMMTERQKMRIEHAKLAVLNNKTKAPDILESDIREGGHAWSQMKGDLPDKELDKAGNNALVRFPIMLAKGVDGNGEHLTLEAKRALLSEQIGFAANSADKLREMRRQNFEDPEDGKLFIEVLKNTKGRATNDKSVFDFFREGGRSDRGVEEWFKENEQTIATQKTTGVTTAAADFDRGVPAILAMTDPAAMATALTAAQAPLVAAIQALRPEDMKRGILPISAMTPNVAEVFGKAARPDTIAAMDPGLHMKFNESLAQRETDIVAGSGTDEQKYAAWESVEEARNRAGLVGNYERNNGNGRFVGTPDELTKRVKVLQGMVMKDPAETIASLTTALGEFKGELAEVLAGVMQKGGAGNADDKGQAVLQKLADQLAKPRSDSGYQAGVQGDQDYARAQQKTIIAINNVAKILEKTHNKEIPGYGTLDNQAMKDGIARLKEKAGI